MIAALPPVAWRCTYVVFSGAVFGQAWFSGHVHGVALQADDMNMRGWPAAGALPRSGRRTEVLKAVVGLISADLETDRKEVLEPETSSLRSRSPDCGGR
ncbi:hypothetical protein RHE_PC00120 (plasmid) [Rhizobium etli CFN 42]|uniref:Uncharacterized protein n=2 Tax=Rhizobium etli TaxID=29449 RepID=Q2K1G6_RHIEC|nr:hypothetical protein RHE_PC00120 [Rhizobium etli CFN 42]ARQ12539.1 hypothetical protein NXC12_PB00135 [Rhizobium etli]